MTSKPPNANLPIELRPRNDTQHEKKTTLTPHPPGSCIMMTKHLIFPQVFAPKAPPSPETVVSEFDMSRSGRIGRMPSKLALEALSDASKSGRVGRMLSDASKSGRMGRMMSDSGRSGIMARTMASPSTSVAGDDSREGGVGRPPVVGKPAVVRLFGGEIDSKDGLSGIAERRAGCDEGPAPAVSNDDRV